MIDFVKIEYLSMSGAENPSAFTNSMVKRLHDDVQSNNRRLGAAIERAHAAAARADSQGASGTRDVDWRERQRAHEAMMKELRMPAVRNAQGSSSWAAASKAYPWQRQAPPASVQNAGIATPLYGKAYGPSRGPLAPTKRSPDSYFSNKSLPHPAADVSLWATLREIKVPNTSGAEVSLWETLREVGLPNPSSARELMEGLSVPKENPDTDALSEQDISRIQQAIARLKQARARPFRNANSNTNAAATLSRFMSTMGLRKDPASPRMTLDDWVRCYQTFPTFAGQHRESVKPVVLQRYKDDELMRVMSDPRMAAEVPTTTNATRAFPFDNNAARYLGTKWASWKRTAWFTDSSRPRLFVRGEEDWERFVYVLVTMPFDPATVPAETLLQYLSQHSYPVSAEWTRADLQGRIDKKWFQDTLKSSALSDMDLMTTHFYVVLHHLKGQAA